MSSNRRFAIVWPFGEALVAHGSHIQLSQNRVGASGALLAAKSSGRGPLPFRLRRLPVGIDFSYLLGSSSSGPMWSLRTALSRFRISSARSRFGAALVRAGALPWLAPSQIFPWPQ